MTASAPGADGQSNRPPAARHFSVAPEPETPEGYVAPGMPGAPVAGYRPVDPAEPDPNAAATPAPNAPGGRRGRGRTGPAVAIAVLAMLAGAAALGCAPIRAHTTVGWLAIAPAAAVAWPLGRLGGTGRLLPPLGAVLASGALFLGQLLGQARRLHHLAGTGYGELLRDALPLWRGDRRTLDLVFYGIAVIGGFLLTRRAATRQ
ncbi:hypothetical protein [Kitasatospora purpeofusca]|uniref:hypothetical protein n=1 Tax=Kitasatospora purpeofusca TaxID=67352 RepID=UPI0038651DA4|nr:hypothetical protein OIP63_15470 [Kitasatospora purpeofusca]